MKTKTLTALVFLVGLTASAQTPSLQGTSVDFDSLMSMHSLGEKVVMQAFNGSACQVTPLSDLPVAVRSIFGRPVSSIFVGQSDTASHFIAGDIDANGDVNGVGGMLTAGSGTGSNHTVCQMPVVRV